MTERTPVPASDAAHAGATGEAPPAGSGRSDNPHRLVFAVTAMGAFMASLDLSIVNVAFPALERSFPRDPSATLAWVITGYSIVFGALLVIGGRTADRLGSRRIFMVGLAVFCLGSALCGLAPSVALLVAGRLVQGAGAAAVLPSSLGLLLAAFPVERRSQVVALWGGIGALAVATGPSLGAALITGFGWRAAFYVNLPVGLLAFLLGRRVLAESRRGRRTEQPRLPRRGPSRRRPRGVGPGHLRGADVGMVEQRGIVASLVGAAVLGTLFLRRSARHAEPVLDLALFGERSFTVANAATLLYAMGFFAMLLGNILFLTSVWHYSILTAGLAVTPGPLVVAFVAGPAGRIAARHGFRPVLLVGFVVFATGLAWLALRVGISREYLTTWLPGTLVVGLGIGLTFPVLSAAAVSSLHQERFSVGSAVNQTARQVGGALGVAVLVVIVGVPHSADAALTAFHHLWWYAAGMAVLSGSVSALLRPVAAMATVTAGNEASRPSEVLRVVSTPPDDRRAPWAPLEEPA